METSIIISLLSLAVAILALPISYWIAVKQVKVGLDEHERRNNSQKQNVVADTLDEFFATFNTILRETTGFEASQLSEKSKEINPYLKNIDDAISKTEIMARLKLSIDELASIEYANLSGNTPIINKLQSIRSQISMGSNDYRYATLGIISAWGGSDTQILRQKDT